MAALIAEKRSGNDRKFSPLMEIESMHVDYSSGACSKRLRFARDEDFCVLGWPTASAVMQGITTDSCTGNP
ncbi:hypothetical protein [Pseudomonas putida]|uniref:hypothetical protein n=1 Tax=Pseudomonas putida TaxID=303 RepID=UPI002164B8C9|nr:hypothetical protein [Pseudomonas putida]